MTAKQDKVRELQRTLYRAAKADPGRRFHALHDKVHRRDVLERAWELVRANRGAAGIDRQTIADVEGYGVVRLLDELAADLREGRWRPLPARRVFIPKPGRDELRPLSIPAVRDRIVQAAVKTVIEPIFGKRRTTGMREGNERVLHRRPSESRWPRPCVGDPRGRSEALDRVHAGRLWSLEMVLDRGADAVEDVGRQYRGRRYREPSADPAGSENPCMRAISPC
jgi:hypothetical protein